MPEGGVGIPTPRSPRSPKRGAVKTPASTSGVESEAAAAQPSGSAPQAAQAKAGTPTRVPTPRSPRIKAPRANNQPQNAYSQQQGPGGTKSASQKSAEAKQKAESLAEMWQAANANGFKTKGMKYVDAKIIKMSKLDQTELAIVNKDLFDVAMASICAYLFTEGCPCDTLTLKKNKFSLNGFMMLLEVLDMTENLTSLNYSGNVIGECPPLLDRDIYDKMEVLHTYMLRGADGAVRLGEKMKTNTTLTKLSLEDNNLKDEGANYIFEALEVNTTLKDFRCAENLVNDLGIDRFCKMLKKNRTLTSIDLDGNTFTSKGAIQIFETLETMPNIIRFGARANDIEPNVAPAIARNLEVGHLKVLNLRRNKLGDTGTSRLSQALGACTTLETLLLSSNRIGNVGCASLSNSLTKNKFLKRIAIDVNQIEDEGAKSFAEMIKVNSTLQHADLMMNEFLAPGCCALADALALNSHLLELHISRSQLSIKEPLARIQYKIKQNRASAGVQDTTGFVQRQEQEAEPAVTKSEPEPTAEETTAT